MGDYYDLETPFGKLWIWADGEWCRVESGTGDSTRESRSITINTVGYYVSLRLQNTAEGWRVPGGNAWEQSREVNSSRVDQQWSLNAMTSAALDKFLAAIGPAVAKWVAEHPAEVHAERVRVLTMDLERANRKLGEAQIALDKAAEEYRAVSVALENARAAS